MKWDRGTSVSSARVGDHTFIVAPRGRAWEAQRWAGEDFQHIGDYPTERQAKAACYRKARALWVRMGRDLKLT